MELKIEKEQIKRLKNWFKGRKEKPYKLDIFLTQACNLKCEFCDCHNVSSKKIMYELNKKEFLRIIDEAAELGIKKVGVLGGEPFVKMDIMLEVMKAVKDKNMCGSLTTNGTLFTEDSIKKIVKMEWEMLRFSIDGRRRTHDYLRGQKGVYNKVVSNLKLFQKYKIGLNKENPTIEFNFVLTNKNYRDLPFVVKLAKETDCKKFYILPLIELTGSCLNLKITEMNNRILRYLKKALELAEKQGIESNINEIINSSVVENSNNLGKVHEKDDSLYCLQPWCGLAIHSNGNVVPCANFEDISGENVKGTPLKKIWFGKYFSNIRNDMKKGKLPDVCSRCCMPQQMENKILKEILKNGQI